MPIENERKYVLDVEQDERAARKFLASLQDLPGTKVYEFNQGYLEGSCRIRQSMPWSVDEQTVNYFTYKTKVNGEQVEIETQISEVDFDLLWLKVSKIVTKIRVVVPTLNGDVWEVDFFRMANRKGFYLVMAEVELPQGVEKPNLLPAFIQSNLLHEVTFGDKRFNSKNLTKPAVVAELLEQIRNGKLQPA